MLRRQKRKKICLVCSSGGHLLELFVLKPFWAGYDRFWVTFRTVDAEFLLTGEKVYYVSHPTQRNIIRLLKNLCLAWKIIKSENPSMIISTGAAVGVPFLWIGKILSIRNVWIESLTMVENLTLSGRLVYPVTDEFLVQWPELAAKFKRAKYRGQII